MVGIDSEWVDGPGGRRVLSYQLVALVGGQVHECIEYPAAGERRGLVDCVFALIWILISERLILRWPEIVYLAIHWSRADLPSFSDFDRIKTEFDSVQNTYATTQKPFLARRSVAGHARSLSLWLIDTLLISPAVGRSLEKLGALYGLEKLDIGGFVEHEPTAGDPVHVPYIERMDRLLTDDPGLFERYAMRDALIAARHAEWMLGFCRDELRAKPLPTLGAMAQSFVLGFWHKHTVKVEDVLGLEIRSERHFDRRSGRYRTSKARSERPGKRYHRELAVEAFHGGRNEAFCYGPTAASRYYEHDLKSAYTTALAAIRIPDYERARVDLDPEAYQVDTLGIARARFRFPAATRYPCLPVEAPNGRGLIYPLEGTTVCTAPEIALARRLGAELDISYGVVVPWANDAVRPFVGPIAEIQRRREAESSGTIANAMWKQIGNSIYGKLGQGLSGRRVYSTRTSTRVAIPNSQITCAFLASYVTGLVRTVMSEMLANFPLHRSAVSVTTDALITDTPFHELDRTGPACMFFSSLREALGFDHEILDEKYDVKQLIPWRTRGIATVPRERERPKLAKGGMQTPGGITDANAWFVQTFLDRMPGSTFTQTQPIDLPRAHEENLDLVFSETETRLGFEFDFKRRPIASEMVAITLPDGSVRRHIAFKTEPWTSLEEFVQARDLFETYREKAAGQLKTLDDWERWLNYEAGTRASKRGIRRSKTGVVDQARRMFLRAAVRGMWGIPRQPYREIADVLTSAGYPTTENDLKKAKTRSGPPEPHLVPADAPAISDLVMALVTAFPTFDPTLLVDGDLPAGALDVAAE